MPADQTVKASEQAPGSARPFDVAIVGAGFAGLYMLHKARALGLAARVYEAGSGVGGTWYWNRYPGARCDVESMQYSYSFDEALQQDWSWSERFAGQPEILTHAEHVADRFDLRRDIRLDARLEAAAWDEAGARWRVTLAGGEGVEARFLVLATGCLSAAKRPGIPGLEDFAGPVLHTGAWPHDGSADAAIDGRHVAGALRRGGGEGLRGLHARQAGRGRGRAGRMKAAPGAFA